MRFALENAEGVPLRLHPAALEDAGRLGNVLPPVAGDDVGDDEEGISRHQRQAGDMVDAVGQGELDQRKLRISEMQACYMKGCSGSGSEPPPGTL